MCNYMIAFSPKYRFRNLGESFVLPSHLLANLIARCKGDDDNRGSGR
ncbi:MAG TPA: hypothetical protein V6D43_13685 [Candidatus Sericytochromatia bacterium]|jgi:hypothetical protein